MAQRRSVFFDVKLGSSWWMQCCQRSWTRPKYHSNICFFSTLFWRADVSESILTTLLFTLYLCIHVFPVSNFEQESCAKVQVLADILLGILLLIKVTSYILLVRINFLIIIPFPLLLSLHVSISAFFSSFSAFSASRNPALWEQSMIEFRQFAIGK